MRVWLIEPAFDPHHFHVSWMDAVAPIAMGGLWVAAFAWQLQKRALCRLTTRSSSRHWNRRTDISFGFGFRL
jgi:hypothetical protein